MWLRLGTGMLVVVLSCAVVACDDRDADSPSTTITPWGTPSRVASEIPVPSPTPQPWSLTISPDHGPVGTRVHLEGDGFVGGSWQNAELPGGYGVFMGAGLGLGWGVCDLVADTDFTIEISDSGHLTADFTVPASGHCFQTDRSASVSPGEYTIGVACHACAVSTFRVTPAE
jgi:hypothetical protein